MAKQPQVYWLHHGNTHVKVINFGSYQTETTFVDGLVTDHKVVGQWAL